MKVRYSMRQIPKKNYFYLLLLVAITVILTLVFFNIYRNYSDNKKSYMSQNLTNINSLDFYDNTNVKNQEYILNKYKIDIKGKKMLLVFEENQLVLKHILKDDVEDEIISIVSKFEDIDD